MPDIKLLNIDCMEFMKDCKDKEFDLAIADPPYGIEWKGTGFKKKNIQERNLNKLNRWDKEPPQEYFDEIKRICKNWVIWGGNYFAHKIGRSPHIILWDKETGDNPFADGEIAFTSFKSNTLRVIRHQWCGAFKDSERGISPIHPTQKPIVIYKWILNKYAKEGDKIFDSHGGSMSIAIACHYMNFDLTLCEIDKDYYEAGVKRYNEAIKQQTLFDFNHSTI